MARDLGRDRCLASVALVAVLASAGGTAFAQEAPRTSSLSWVRMPGAESCLSTRALAEAVEGRLGRSVFVSASRGEVSVEGRVERLIDHWSAVVTLSAPDGTLLGNRTLESVEPECSALDGPLALVIALMIDPDAAAEPEPEPEPARAPARTPAPAPRPPARPSPAPVVLDADARLSIAVGLLPGASIGLTASASLRPPAWPALVAEAALYPPRTARADAGRADFLLAWGGLAICPVDASPGPLHLRLCGGLLLGALSVRPVGLDGSASGERFVGSGAVRAAAGVRLSGPVLLRGSLALLVPFPRDRFLAEGDELFRMSVVALAFDLGLAVRFP